MPSLGDAVLASNLVDSEFAAATEARDKLARDVAEAEEELSQALVIRRHVARSPERFAPHEREDVFERTERLVARREELQTLLRAAGERISFVEQLRRSLAAEQERMAEDLAARYGAELASARAETSQVQDEARRWVEQLRGELELSQAELAAAHAELEQRHAAPAGALPALEIHQAVEGERLRIARDLHDGPAQVLSNLALEAEIIERLLKRDPQLVAAELQEFRNSVTNAVADIRRFMFDLRPDSLDDLGLVATLRRLTTEWQQRTDVVCRLNIVGDERRLAASIEEALFRIIQEALNNVRHHAAAKTVEVNLDFGAERVSLRVRDDGRGFDPDAEPPEGARRQLGVVGMRERAAAVGGHLDVRSTPGQGTEIQGDFPVAL